MGLHFVYVDARNLSYKSQAKIIVVSSCIDAENWHRLSAEGYKRELYILSCLSPSRDGDHVYRSGMPLLK